MNQPFIYLVSQTLLWVCLVIGFAYENEAAKVVALAFCWFCVTNTPLLLIREIRNQARDTGAPLPLRLYTLIELVAIALVIVFEHYVLGALMTVQLILLLGVYASPREFKP